MSTDELDPMLARKVDRSPQRPSRPKLTPGDGESRGSLRVTNVGVALLAPGSDEEAMLALDFTIEDAAGETRKLLLAFDRTVDPYIVAGDILGAADVMLRQALIDDGLEKIEQEIGLRLKRRDARIARRQLVESVAESHATTCSFCNHSTAFVIDGVRYCKRHAEERGVRPKGKIT